MGFFEKRSAFFKIFLVKIRKNSFRNFKLFFFNSWKNYAEKMFSTHWFYFFSASIFNWNSVCFTCLLLTFWNLKTVFFKFMKELRWKKCFLFASILFLLWINCEFKFCVFGLLVPRFDSKTVVFFKLWKLLPLLCVFVNIEPENDWKNVCFRTKWSFLKKKFFWIFYFKLFLQFKGCEFKI